MKNIKLILIIPLLCGNIVYSQVNNSNWTHVGPKSLNVPGNFETGLINNYVTDPYDPQHLFVASIFGGLWESNDRGDNWTNIDTKFTGSNGIIDIDFMSPTKILVGAFQKRYTLLNSTGAYIYDFGSDQWSATGAINLPAGANDYAIKSVEVHPQLTNPYLFLCTSVGLYRSINSGVSWQLIITGCIENMAFIPKPSNSGYFCYIAGSNALGDNSAPTGKLMVKQSIDDGATFPTDLSANFPITSTFNYSHSKLCAGDVIGNNYTLYLMTCVLNSTTNNWDRPTNDVNAGIYLHRLVKDIVGGGITYPAISGNLNQSTYGSPDRMGFAYDPQGNVLYFGGVYLYNYNFNTNAQNYVGGTHNDIHDIDIKLYNSNYEMNVTTDGGMYRTALSPSISFVTKNKGLDICSINGFSGSAINPNKYSLGSQDITHVDIFDVSAGTYKTHPSGESDGTFIDKFDDNLILMDYQSYDYASMVSKDGGQTISGNSGPFNPKTTSPFEANTASPVSLSAEFGMQQFKQDPFRPGKIYRLGGMTFAHIAQYDLKADAFVLKNTLGGYFPDPAWESRLVDLSFSQQSSNSVYALTSARYFPIYSMNTSSKVFKYIGPDFYDCWGGHNEYTTSGGAPQWQLITPDFLNLSNIGGGAVNIPAAEIGKGSLTAIVTSPWDQNILYASCSILGNPNVKVMKYNGTSWENYSSGIAPDEFIASMVMDNGSNDGIYVCSDKKIYYRDATMNSWMEFSTGYPMLHSKQLEINYKVNTLRAGTYGRGIWKSQLVCPTQSLIVLSNVSLAPETFIEANSITANVVYLTLNNPEVTALRATTKIELNPGFTAEPSVVGAQFHAFIHGCLEGSSSSTPNFFKSNSTELTEAVNGDIEEQQEIKVFPNPNAGLFTIVFDRNLDKKEKGERFEQEMDDENEMISVSIFNVVGSMVYSKQNIPSSTTELSVNLQDQAKGLYFVKIVKNGHMKTAKVVFQ